MERPHYIGEIWEEELVQAAWWRLPHHYEPTGRRWWEWWKPRERPVSNFEHVLTSGKQEVVTYHLPKIGPLYKRGSEDDGGS